MSTTFALVNESVIQVTQSGRAYDQLIQNRFDIVLENVTGTVNSSSLLTSLVNLWGAEFAPLISDQYFHVQTKIQVVLDVLAGVSGPKRVYGNLDRIGPQTSNNGTAADPSLPYDIAMSVQLVTAGAPGPYWGKKAFGPIPNTAVTGDGESLDPAVKASWEAASLNFFVSPHTLTASTATWRGVVLPGTFVANQTLPHAALFTYVRDIIQTDIGTYIGSQKTRRITPYSLRGH